MRPGTWGLRTGDLYKHYTDITHGHSPLTIGRTQLTQNTRPGPSPPPGNSVLCIQLHFADCRLELQHKYENGMICLFSRPSNRTTIRYLECKRKVSSCCLTCCYLLFIVVRVGDNVPESPEPEPEPGTGGRGRPGRATEAWLCLAEAVSSDHNIE